MKKSNKYKNYQSRNYIENEVRKFLIFFNFKFIKYVTIRALQKNTFLPSRTMNIKINISRKFAASKDENDLS